MMIYPDHYSYVEHIASHEHTSVLRVQSVSGEHVALKLQDNMGNVPRRFQREIEAMVVAAGPSTMPVLDYDETYSWYTMPLASKDLSKECTPTEPKFALSILRTIADALRPIHVKGQVHRDLKPENILLLPNDDGDRWVLADFGIVRNTPGETTSTLTVEGHLTGTPIWAAPEQHRDAHSATVATDVYSAGLLMGWLLTGKRPAPGIPYSSLGRLTATISRATAPEPSRRFQTVDEFVSHFEDHMMSTRASVESMITEGSYGKVYSYLVAHPERLTTVATTLMRLNDVELISWVRADMFGLVEAVKYICGNLRDNFNSLGRDKVDGFLVWLLAVCDVLKSEDRLAELGEVLSAQVSTTTDLDQWTPRIQALDWIDRQPPNIEDVARSVLEETDTWNYFAEEARLRWASKRTTELLRDLADS